MWHNDRVGRIPNTECLICSTPIYRRPSQISRNKGRVFCSIKCFNETNKVLIPCTNCGKLLGPNEKRRRRKTCSKECHIKRIGHGKGTPHRKPVELLKNWPSIRERILEERGRSCESCGYCKIPDILHVHHKNGRLGQNAHDPNNLAVFCPNCHAEEHWRKRQKVSSLQS